MNPILPLFLVAGLLLGLAHFATLSMAVARYADGCVAMAVALHAGRLLVLGAALYGLARLGAGPLLAGALGLLAGRAIVLRRARRRIS